LAQIGLQELHCKESILSWHRGVLSLQGYFLASFLFLAIVFALPICLGLGALALDLPVRPQSVLSFEMRQLCLTGLIHERKPPKPSSNIGAVLRSISVQACVTEMEVHHKRPFYHLRLLY
jgi:hypothetical protein